MCTCVCMRQKRERGAGRKAARGEQEGEGREGPRGLLRRTEGRHAGEAGYGSPAVVLCPLEMPSQAPAIPHPQPVRGTLYPAKRRPAWGRQGCDCAGSQALGDVCPLISALPRGCVGTTPSRWRGREAAPWCVSPWQVLALGGRMSSSLWPLHGHRLDVPALPRCDQGPPVGRPPLGTSLHCAPCFLGGRVRWGLRGSATETRSSSALAKTRVFLSCKQESLSLGKLIRKGIRGKRSGSFTGIL